MLDDLSIVPYAEIFRRVSSQRLSGDLQVRARRAAKIIFFDRGALVFAASNARKDRLGESLVALGHLSEKQFQSASALMRQNRRRRFGEALQAAGLMDEKEVGRARATTPSSARRLPRWSALADVVPSPRCLTRSCCG